MTVNVIRDGVPTPVPYQPQLFDYGRTKIERPLPVNLGFAGFRLHYPLNNPRVFDEVIAFLGASYFRFLGRDQRYGLSARGLAHQCRGEGRQRSRGVSVLPRVLGRDPPGPATDRAIVYALLDGPSTTGAYRFEIYPGSETTLDIGVTLFPRRSITSVGVAPLTSMYLPGRERPSPDGRLPARVFTTSDGLMIHTGAGEWIWRPIRNLPRKWISGFSDNNPRGFGLMQRDRSFESYQDLEAVYHRRPGYWVEPTGPWGEGRVELVEIPTANETHDNIVAYWTPKQPYEPGQEIAFGYRMSAIGSTDDMHPGGKVVNTFQTPARASGSAEPGDPTTRRFLIDFAGGDLEFYLGDPALVQVVPSASAGRITHTFVVPNPHTRGFRAAFDVKLEAGQTTDLRAFLRAGGRTLTETWTYPWTAE